MKIAQEYCPVFTLHLPCISWINHTCPVFAPALSLSTKTGQIYPILAPLLPCFTGANYTCPVFAPNKKTGQIYPILAPVLPRFCPVLPEFGAKKNTRANNGATRC